MRDAGTWIVDSQDSGYKHEECAVTATLSLILAQTEQTEDYGHGQFCFNAQYIYTIITCFIDQSGNIIKDIRVQGKKRP